MQPIFKPIWADNEFSLFHKAVSMRVINHNDTCACTNYIHFDRFRMKCDCEHAKMFIKFQILLCLLAQEC